MLFMYDGKSEKEWDALFFKQMELLAISGDILDSQNITISNGYIYLGREKLYSGTKYTIDDILICFSWIALVLVYFE